jgi:hypothetical protein
MTMEKDGRRHPRFKAPKPVLAAWKRGTEKHEQNGVCFTNGERL